MPTQPHHHDPVQGGVGLAVAARLRRCRTTAQRYARAVTWQELVDGKWRQPRPSKLDPFKPYLQQRWEQGCRDAAQLYREVGARGFAGSYALVRSYLDAYRVRPDPTAPPPPTVRQVTGWLTRHPPPPTEDDQVRLKAVLEQCPELRSAAGHVRTFGETGRVNHIKMLKRQMFGRASLPLLRKRVLLTAAGLRSQATRA
jgi:hypothetical protein